MSEVKRYGAAFASVNESEDGNYVLFEEFDRVTAERDAALGREAELKSSFDELAASVGFSEARLDQTGDSPIDCANQLQQRLTAADERADVLEGLLRRVHKSSALTKAGDLWKRIDAALKPAEGLDRRDMAANMHLMRREGGGDEN